MANLCNPKWWVRTGFFSNCGGDFTFQNNLFVDIGTTIRQSGRSEFGTVKQTLWNKLHDVPFTSAVWRKRFPQLEARFSSWRNGSLPPLGTTAPRDNVYIRNVAVNITGSKPIPGEGSASRFFNWTANADDLFSLPAPFFTPNSSNTTQFFDIRPDNLRTDDPMFVSSHPGEDLNFALRESSPLFALGWQAIPQSEIGPSESE